MTGWAKIIRGLYLKRKIERTEKRLCKYVSKFVGVNVVSVGQYLKEGAVKDEQAGSSR